MTKHIVVIAGEASGDAHAGRVIAALKAQRPDITVSGIGGNTLRDAGADIFTDFSELAVMGIVEVLKRYRSIKAIFNQVVERLKQAPPDLLILVDYPGFNLKLAKKAHQMGIPVMYYISPKVWAWKPGRVKKIKQYVDHIAVLFPFEVPIYKEIDQAVTCVGHPLVDSAKSDLTTEQAKTQFDFTHADKVIGLFPGSRQNEIKALLPVMLEAAQKLLQAHPDCRFLLPQAPGLERAFIEPFISSSSLPVKVVEGDFYDVIKSCDAIVAASGTVTLEVALLGVPHFIIYRLSPLSFSILKRLVNIPYVGLCNIVTGENCVTELLQDDVTVENLFQQLEQRLQEQAKMQAEQVRQQVLTALGPSGAANNTANLIIELLEEA